MRKALVFTMIILTCTRVVAQQQSFDVVSYTAPQGWQQQRTEGGVQLSVSDKQSGAYAVAVIVKAKDADADPKSNFDIEWAKLVKGTVQVNEAPAMLSPEKEKGWEIISGTAHYTDGGQKGLVTLMTATGGGKMASVVLMTNTDRYQDELLAFLHSLGLSDIPQNGAAVNEQGSNGASIAGLWVRYTIETSGYANGFPQPSGGYFRKEYAFYDDGTYLFRMKNWAVYVKEIQYVYESGTWRLNGNQLTITPREGNGGWWAKAKSGKTSGWGGLAQSGSWKLEPVTYTIDLHYYSGSNETHLVLQSPSPTEREGKLEDNKETYSPRAIGHSLIDNPPGIRTGFEGKGMR
ncbi:hypothetical protein ACQKLP_05530 [Chitinophaga sp. NPDC101104]|uniref:hypothetical protein n=1 Tax=Chitinophaga sp. NPDC101104 TaxID=3390561 RepID=UPI003CFC57BD